MKRKYLYFLVLARRDFLDFLFFLVLLPPYLLPGELNSEPGSEVNENDLVITAGCCDKLGGCDKIGGCDKVRGCDNLPLELLPEFVAPSNLEGRLAEGFRIVSGSCGGAPKT